MTAHARNNASMTSTARYLRAIPATATPEEAAAIVAAVERFVRATAPTAVAVRPPALDAWQRAALLEGVSCNPWTVLDDPALASPWINT
jgi:hypothetical protein